MSELTTRKRVARLFWGLVILDVGLFVVWKSHDIGLGISASRLLAGVGGMIAMYGLMSLLGSGVLAIVMVLGGVGFFSWSLWSVSSSAGDLDLAKFGLWSGPLIAILGLVFFSPVGRSRASKKSKW